MELEKLSKDEIKSFDRQRLGEVEVEIRRQLALIRMDFYTDKKQQGGKIRGLKKNLARVLTSRTQLLANQAK